jgi:hypothetical protein
MTAGGPEKEMSGGKPIPMWTSTSAIVPAGEKNVAAKTIVTKSSFFILLPPINPHVQPQKKKVRHHLPARK